MKILIVGSGAREHALAYKCSLSQLVKHVYVAPGNAGTGNEPNVSNVNIPAHDIEKLVAFASNNEIDITIIGPDLPLEMGIVNAFQDSQLLCFGPTKEAAKLEWSKEFCKDFLTRHNVLTGQYKAFSTMERAIDYLYTLQPPFVIKADGLASGKGVVIAQTYQQADDVIYNALHGDVFGEAGKRIVIEQFLEGIEMSFTIITDGNNVVPLTTSQDYKQLYINGPMTGGMGSASPSPITTPSLYKTILNEIVFPIVRGMAAENNLFVGFMYIGLMISPDGIPKVLEVNSRIGDPECQVLMMRMMSDLVPYIQGALTKTLDKVPILLWSRSRAVNVVLASRGYPHSVGTGKLIEGLHSTTPFTKIFHGATIEVPGARGEVMTNGGRVLNVCALGQTFKQARNAAYNRAKEIYWDGMYYRDDIGLLNEETTQI